MRLISLEEAKQYLRVDSPEEDGLIGFLCDTATSLVYETGRLTAEEKKDLEEGTEEEPGESGIDLYKALLKTAAYFSLGYLYEHREEADHHGLVLTLRNLLFPVREGKGEA